MMVMTAKVNLKKIILIIAAAAALILAAILLMGGSEEKAVSTAAASMSGNDARVQFLKNFGWDVTTSPTESSQVKIPKEHSDVFDRYNTLQKGQGYDLSEYAGKKVMRYVYQINNYPNASAPVYATLLISGGKVIGGDITDTSANGKIRGFKMPEPVPAATATDPSVSLPSESTATPIR